MLSMFIFDQDGRELTNLMKISSDVVAYCSNDNLNIQTTTEYSIGKQFVEKRDLLDAGFFDVTEKKGLELVRQFRKYYELADFLLISDSKVSPMEYMTPEIRAASLLLRPFTEEQRNQVIFQFFRALYRNRNNQKDEKKLVVENRQGTIAIPYSSIYYLEVREKRIFIRLKEKEYSKYETMENMIKELPQEFIRCHRSFVVNTSYINRIKLSDNVICLEDGIVVPLSRSYKGQMKEYMKHLQNRRE